MSDFYARPEGRFTEEIVLAPDDDAAVPFDVVIKDFCGADHEPEFFVNGGPICSGSYYNRLAELMTDDYELRPADRPRFIRYQMNIRKDKLKFLRELEELVTDNQRYFDDRLAGSGTDYHNIIDNLRQKLTSSLADRILITVELLKQARTSGANDSISGLLRAAGYPVVADDEKLIADELEKRGLIKTVRNKDGIFASLTVEGVMFDPATPKNADADPLSNADLLDAITAHFDRIMADQSVLIARGQFDLSEMTEEINEAVEQLNAKAGGKAKGPIRRIADSYVGKLFLSELTKRGIIKPTLDGAEVELLELAEEATRLMG